MIRIVLVYGLPILLAIYALVDCIQTDESEIRGLPKFGWIALIVLVFIVGPVAWLVAGRSRTGGSRLPLPGGNRSPQAPRTLAPDDDPEFLGRLGSHNSYDRQLEEWEEELRKRTGDDPPSSAPDADDPNLDDPDDGPDSNRPVR
jgi:hypothetical protein